MDEASGNIQDSSGNGNHQIGAETGGGTGFLTYQQSGAIRTDTSSTSIRATPPYVAEIADATSLNLADVCTLECWLKFAVAPSTETFILSKQTNGYELRHTSTGALRLTKADVATICDSTVVIPNDGNFHHCVATKNGTAAHLYLDGVDVTGTVDTGVSPLANTGLQLRVFGYFDGLPSINGYLDEVALYATDLTQARVQAHYAAASGVAIAGRINSLSWVS